jgi:uncharacterized protein
METPALLFLLASIMLFGLVGLLTPIIPGLIIIWLAVLVYAFTAGLTWVSGLIFAGITLLMIAGTVTDEIMMGTNARKSGASWWSIAVATIAGLVGSAVLPPLGGLLFALVGRFIVEFIRLRNWRAALTSTGGMAVGCGMSFFIRFGIGLVMIALWLVWVFVL